MMDQKEDFSHAMVPFPGDTKRQAERGACVALPAAP